MSSIKAVMIVIVDNGNGAENISRLIRMPTKIVKPSQIDSVKANAYILSDGDVKNQKVNEKLIQKTNVPILGIGAGYLFVGAAFGAKVKSTGKTEKQERLTLKKPCPLTLDLKRMFVVHQKYQNIFTEVPENFTIAASSPKYEYEIIMEMERPVFGVNFLPEKGGDGMKVLDNFIKFVEVWEKYHR